MVTQPRSARILRAGALCILFILCVLLAGLLFDVWRSGSFTSPEALTARIRTNGALAPLALILIQLCQVVVPMLPGAVGCVAGVLLFGPVQGFVYNYIAAVAGSLLAYGLAYRYGDRLAHALMGQTTYEKYSGFLHRHDFTWVFLVAVFLPLAPDDIFCYLAGLARLRPARVALILLLGKPWVTLSYSLASELLSQL
ncbi:MAG: TVP38/TMEM64 family protein [Oscillospiraceae bacterium]|nr:TVP38/TMEM64 family protein [Oscillospiraceae bacterium]